MKRSIKLLALGFALHLSSSLMASNAEIPAIDLDDKIAEIENESQTEITSGTSETLKNLYKNAQSRDEAATSLNDCRNITELTSECNGDPACKDYIWKISKRCIRKHPELESQASFGDWLKDRLRRLRQEIRLNDQKVTFLNGDINRAKAISAKAKADIANYDAEISKIRLNTTMLDNEVTQEKIDDLRFQNAELKAKMDQKEAENEVAKDTTADSSDPQTKEPSA